MLKKYRADIDGLRTIAVLSVIFFHADIGLFQGGYTGVDIFFVISGFLITSIIVHEIKNNKFKISNFYERRFRRILPALTVVIIASLLAGLAILNPNNLKDLGMSTVATALFTSNFFFYSTSGYFAGPAESMPLLHTWSLAVEEQFYILLPILLLLISKTKGNNFFAFLLLFFIVSFSACVYLTPKYSSFSFYLLPTRAWELLLGSIVALNVLPKLTKQWQMELLSTTGLAMIAYSVLFYNSETVFPGIAALLPTAGTALIIYAGGHGSPFVSKLLGLKPMVFIGLLSYSLYLWHWPIIVYMKTINYGHLNPEQLLITMAAVFVASYCSWRFIETPFREKKLLANKKPLLTGSLVTTLAFLAFGSSLVVSNGLPNRLNNKESNLITDVSDDEWNTWKQCEKVVGRIKRGKGLCSIGHDSGQAEFILWGDSHAKALASGVNTAAINNQQKGIIATQSACPPLLSIERPGRASCDKFNTKVLEHIASNKELTTVFLAARWALSENGSRYKHEKGSKVQLIDLKNPDSSADNHELFEIGLTRTIRELKKLNLNVVIINQVPEVGLDVPSLAYTSELRGDNINNILGPKVEDFKDRIQGTAAIFAKLAAQEGATIINPAELLCTQKICIVESDGNLIYRDDDHLSTYGSKFVSSSLNDALRSMPKKPNKQITQN